VSRRKDGQSRRKPENCQAEAHEFQISGGAWSVECHANGYTAASLPLFRHEVGGVTYMTMAAKVRCYALTDSSLIVY
jgi:hypothetical protein